MNDGVRSESQAADGRHVSGGPVSLMSRKAIFWIDIIKTRDDSIPENLGHDRSSGNGINISVTFYNRFLWSLQLLQE